jgi:cation diffusion facilitator family transporter
MDDASRIGRRVAIASMAASGTLAVVKIVVGLWAGSTSVVADGVESASDVLASGMVFLGLLVAARPADANHPYGHGRFEILTGLGVGMILAGTGTAICMRSLERASQAHTTPQAYALWALVLSIVVKSVLSWTKFRVGRRIGSAALLADAWNDSVDILSGFAALCALSLTLYNPVRFLAADHYGGFAVGLLVILLGIRVVRDTASELMDTMPEESRMAEVRAVALAAPGVLGVEKCFARKTGFKYHVDIHLEVDPHLTVWASHEIATQVRFKIRGQLDWVADVLVHVEPYPHRSNPQPALSE